RVRPVRRRDAARLAVPLHFAGRSAGRALGRRHRCAAGPAGAARAGADRRRGGRGALSPAHPWRLNAATIAQGAISTISDSHGGSMTFGRSNRISTALAAGVLLVAAAEARAQRPIRLDATRSSPAELRAADRLVDQLIRDRALVATSIETDPLVSGRTHERFEQYVRGVRIAGGDITRQTATDGTVSLFGLLHGDLALSVTPGLSRDEAAAAIARAAGGVHAIGPVAVRRRIFVRVGACDQRIQLQRRLDRIEPVLLVQRRALNQ